MRVQLLRPRHRTAVISSPYRDTTCSDRSGRRHLFAGRWYGVAERLECGIIGACPEHCSIRKLRPILPMRRSCVAVCRGCGLLPSSNGSSSPPISRECDFESVPGKALDWGSRGFFSVSKVAQLGWWHPVSLVHVGLMVPLALLLAWSPRYGQAMRRTSKAEADRGSVHGPTQNFQRIEAPKVRGAPMVAANVSGPNAFALPLV